MANPNYYNKDGSKSNRVDKSYVVDSGDLFDLGLLQRIEKPEREMLVKIIIWLWIGPGRFAMFTSFCAFVFNWIHIGDIRGFITLAVAVITGVSKVIVTWAEKGDLIKEKWRKTFRRKRRV